MDAAVDSRTAAAGARSVHPRLGVTDSASVRHPPEVNRTANHRTDVRSAAEQFGQVLIRGFAARPSGGQQ
jgi:hypothetical protein